MMGISDLLQSCMDRHVSWAKVPSQEDGVMDCKGRTQGIYGVTRYPVDSMQASIPPRKKSIFSGIIRRQSSLDRQDSIRGRTAENGFAEIQLQSRAGLRYDDPCCCVKQAGQKSHPGPELVSGSFLLGSQI